MKHVAAFPCPMSAQTHSNQDCGPFQAGMTLRDYFAARATEADIAEHRTGSITEGVVTGFDGFRRVVHTPTVRTREQAKFAYADAMLRAREAA